MKRIIWDIYFDPTVSRKYGRRVNKKLDFQKLEDAIKSLGLEYNVTTAKFPRIPWRQARKFEIEWNKPKWTLIKEIEKKLMEIKNQ